MKVGKIIFSVYIALIGLTMGGCHRVSDQFYEDSCSAGRHMSRGLRTMGGKHGDSRAVQCRDDFMCFDEDGNPISPPQNMMGMQEFVPLADQYDGSEIAMGDYISPPAREMPGDPGSSIPGIEAFQDPSTNPTWSHVFRNINFDLNSNLVKGQVNLETINNIANYMKRNPNVYIFVEGHCDEKGAAAYNFALGLRRSNSVRDLLIQQGVNPNNVFTISYGKDRPLFFDHNEDSWAQNRRAEFKIYQRS